ncbi:MAG: hypothetical protein AAGF07_03515 [Patescibacteria group bacterium]
MTKKYIILTTIFVPILLLVGSLLIACSYFYGNIKNIYEAEYNEIYDGNGWQFSSLLEVIPCNYLQPNDLKVKALVKDKFDEGYSIYFSQFNLKQEFISNEYRLDKYTYNKGSASLEGGESEVFKVYRMLSCDDLSKDNLVDGVKIRFNEPPTLEEIKENEQRAEARAINSKAEEEYLNLSIEGKLKQDSEILKLIQDRIQSVKEGNPEENHVLPANLTSLELMERTVTRNVLIMNKIINNEPLTPDEEQSAKERGYFNNVQ